MVQVSQEVGLGTLEQLQKSQPRLPCWNLILGGGGSFCALSVWSCGRHLMLIMRRGVRQLE